MRWLADESVDRAIVDRLRSEGHSVQYVAEFMPSAPDEYVLREANDSDAVLLTADKDFGDLVFRRRLIRQGVVLLRLAGLSTDEKAGVVAALLREFAEELRGGFSVVSPTHVRTRRAIDLERD